MDKKRHQFEYFLSSEFLLFKVRFLIVKNFMEIVFSRIFFFFKLLTYLFECKYEYDFK